MLHKLFRFTHFRKNYPATPLESYTFKTKDLKSFRITHFQKKGRGWGREAVQDSSHQISGAGPSYFEFRISSFESQLSTFNCRLSTFVPKSFRFTLLCKNASATPFVSHSCKNKGLKVPWNHTLTKNIGGRGVVWVSLSNIQHLTSTLRSSLSDHPTRMVVPSEHRESRDLSFGVTPLTSTLTKNASATPLTSTLTKKGGRGIPTFDSQLSTVNYAPHWGYLSPVTASMRYNPPARCPVGKQTIRGSR